jgi:hypothetical protein
MLARMQENYREFGPGEAPRVQVLTDGQPRQGVLTAWEKLGGEWWAYVEHDSDDQHIHVYAAERVQGAEPPDEGTPGRP